MPDRAEPFTDLELPVPLTERAAPGTGGIGGVPMTRHLIDLAYERINRGWREVSRRQPLIAELTALDWHARALAEPHPVDDNLIGRISALRSQIWLSNDG